MSIWRPLRVETLDKLWGYACGARLDDGRYCNRPIARGKLRCKRHPLCPKCGTPTVVSHRWLRMAVWHRCPECGAETVYGILSTPRAPSG